MTAFAQVDSGSRMLQKALGLSFFKFSALMLHLLCVSPHAEAECRTVVQRLAVAVSAGKD